MANELAVRHCSLCPDHRNRGSAGGTPLPLGRWAYGRLRQELPWFSLECRFLDAAASFAWQLRTKSCVRSKFKVFFPYVSEGLRKSRVIPASKEIEAPFPFLSYIGVQLRRYDSDHQPGPRERVAQDSQPRPRKRYSDMNNPLQSG